MSTIVYVTEKLNAAVESLVKGTSSIQDRLDGAASTMFTLEIKDFPIELQAEFVAICNILNNKKGVKGLLHSTASTLSDDDASKVAKRLFGLYSSILEYRE